MKMFTVGSKEDTDFIYVGWHMKQSRHSITVSQDNYIKEVVFENQCKPYVEATYYMQNEESYVKKPLNNCTGVIETNIERACFDVSELVGDLVEVINDVTGTNSVELNCKRDKSTKNDGHGPKGVVYDRKPIQNCYNIPRKTQVEVCKTDVHRYYEKFANIFPFPVKEQNCHFKPKEICEDEMKTCPKKAKKYNYTKDCKEQPREICDQCEKKNTQLLCDTQGRMVRTYKANRK